jgi:hypothetical protein
VAVIALAALAIAALANIIDLGVITVAALPMASMVVIKVVALAVSCRHQSTEGALMNDLKGINRWQIAIIILKGP